MRPGPWRPWLLALALSACGIGCDDDDPTRPPENRDPVIVSLTAFPVAIGPGDSTVVFCHATDPDDDALVYDWVTDSRLVIKGYPPSTHEVFGSPIPFHVFYHGPVLSFDSAWVECTTRDRKGGNSVRMVTILVNQ